MPTTRIDDLDIVWDVAGPPDGEPVVLLNGLGSVRGSWFLQVPALAERYRVYTLDNRDIGETGAGANPHAYAMARFADDTAGLIERLGLGPVHLIGASMGGAIAQELLLARPDLVRSAQIVCSWARTDPWLGELVRQWDAMYAAMGPAAWARNSWLWVFTYRWFADAGRIAGMNRDLATLPAPATAGMFARQCDSVLGFDVLDRLPTIRVPVQVVAGEEDLLTPLRFSEAIAAAIPGARLAVLPGVGHGMFWEKPDAFNAALLGFLDASRG